MIALSARLDGFKFQFPKEFIVDDIRDKYADILARKNSFITEPIEFLNETIKGCELLGFNGASVQLLQQSKDFSLKEKRLMTNPASEYSYRSTTSPLTLIDKTFSVTIRHTLGYVNYFLLFENFFYLYARDANKENYLNDFNVNILNDNGSIYSRVVLMKPIMDGIESLPFNYTLPTSDDRDFKVTFKYSNIDFQFLPSEEDCYNYD